MPKKPPRLDPPIRRERALVSEEKALWQRVIDGRPLDEPQEVKPAKPVKPTPISQPPLVKKPISITPESKIDRTARSKLSRGVTAIDATLDLHGMTREEAHHALIGFIRNVAAKGQKTALVITGKGGRGSGEGVLKQSFSKWLQQSPLREWVIAYDSAGPAHGGSGAWYLRIRKAAK